MLRFLYTLLFYGVQPLVWLRLLWRARRQPEYLQQVRERYGFYPPFAPKPLIWLHVVSVGETRAAEPLIKALLAAYPTHSILLTHMTPTGRATGGELIAKYGERLLQAYSPYDLPCACRRFLRHFAPQMGLLMETELWPNLIFSAAQKAIPMALINARLSEKSFLGYQRVSALIRPSLQALQVVLAQTNADAERLRALGANKPLVCGNIKFDVMPDPTKRALGAHWRHQIQHEKPRYVWLAASTREGEETLILDAYCALACPELLLILVPRHPQRFNAVYAEVIARGLKACRRSEEGVPSSATHVWLGDSMGEMPAYFAAADIALMGGTLLPFGGQNLIEAAACGCPVLLGPHTFNFAQASHDALKAGAALAINDAQNAASEALRILQDSVCLAAMRAAAQHFSQAHSGATARTLAVINTISALNTPR